MVKRSKPLEPNSRDAKSIKAIHAKVEKLQGGEIKDHRVKAKAVQATTIEVESCDTARGTTAANTLPVTAVGAILPR